MQPDPHKLSLSVNIASATKGPQHDNLVSSLFSHEVAYFFTCSFSALIPYFAFNL